MHQKTLRDKTCLKSHHKNQEARFGRKISKKNRKQGGEKKPTDENALTLLTASKILKKRVTQKPWLRKRQKSTLTKKGISLPKKHPEN